MSENKNVPAEEVEEISLDDLSKVSGGAFGNVPRVPTKEIDDSLKENALLPKCPYERL